MKYFSIIYFFKDDVQIVVHLNRGVRIVKLAQHDPLGCDQWGVNLDEDVGMYVLGWVLKIKKYFKQFF